MAFLSEEDRKRILAQMLSGQMMRPPAPVVATPAAPLPGAPLQAPVVAPQSERAVAAPQFDEFAAARQMIQPQTFTPTGNKDIDAVLARNAQTRQTGAQNMLQILSQARMNPEEEGLLADRRARVAKELEQLDKDKKREGWAALARAGFKMAQSNSPYFMQALASGLEAGVEGLDEAKLKREEKRSRLQAADEDARLAAIRGRQTAQDRALAVYNAALAAGKSEQEADALARKAAEEQVTLPQRLEMAKLEVLGKRAEIDKDQADAYRLRQMGLHAGDRGDSSSSGGPRPLPPGARAEAEGRLATAYQEQDEAYRDWVKAGKPTLGQVKQDTREWEVASKYSAARGKVNNLRRILGQPSLGELRPSARPWDTNPRNAAARRSGQRPAAAAPARGGSMPKSFTGTAAEWNAMTPAEKKLFQ